MPLPIEFTPEQIARIKLRYENSLTPVTDIARDEGVSDTAIHRLRRRFDWVSRSARGRKAIADSIVHEKAISAAARAQGLSPLRAGDGRSPRKNAHPPAEKPQPAEPQTADARHTPAPADPNLAHAASPKRKNDASFAQGVGASDANSFDAMSLVRSMCAALETELTAARKRLAAEAPATAEASARTLATLARALTLMRALQAEEQKNAERNGSTDDQPPLDLAELRRELARRIDLLRAEWEAS